MIWQVWRVVSSFSLAFSPCYYSNNGLPKPNFSCRLLYEQYVTFCCGLVDAERNRSSVLQSCPDAIDEVFDSKLHIIGGVGITIGIILVCFNYYNSHRLTKALNNVLLPPLLQVFGMIFSMLLCCAIRKSREVVWDPPSLPEIIDVAWCHS